MLMVSLLIAPMHSGAVTIQEANEAIQRTLNQNFCAPDQIFPQSAAWIAQPIRPDPWGQGGNLTVTLDQQIHQLLAPLITEYAQEHGLDIRVREGTCGTSAGLVSRKAVDIAGYCCPPGKSDRLPGLTFHTLGIAAIAILVHPDNPLTDLSMSQIQEIFRGHPRKWSEISDRHGILGPAWPIQPIGRLHCKLRPGHWRAMLGSPDDFSPLMEEVGAIPDMIQRVLAQRGSMGYETLWHVDRFKNRGRPKTIAIDGQAPDHVAALLAGHYPLYHVFNLTMWEQEGITNPLAQPLVQHLIQAVESMDPQKSMLPATALRKAGWQFQNNELIGEPRP
ncbi:MAG: substrate-binding domain-containing protein [Magnetococcales bacterium]|nr:substrate-binding domain-containing protein [Magnetococcales bacterium]